MNTTLKYQDSKFIVATGWVSHKNEKWLVRKSERVQTLPLPDLDSLLDFPFLREKLTIPAVGIDIATTDLNLSPALTLTLEEVFDNETITKNESRKEAATYDTIAAIPVIVKCPDNIKTKPLKKTIDIDTFLAKMTKQDQFLFLRKLHSHELSETHLAMMREGSKFCHRKAFKKPKSSKIA